MAEPAEKLANTGDTGGPVQAKEDRIEARGYVSEEAANNKVAVSSLRQGLFMISCAARTGSSMLANMLQSHPAILCHMEIFAPAKVEGFLGIYRQRMEDEEGYERRLHAYRRDHPSAFLYKIAFDSQNRRAVGFKFKHEEFLLPMFAEARQAILADLDIRVVHLRRRNLVKRYLSWHVANRVTGRTFAFEGQEKPHHDPVRLDPVECRNNIEETLRRETMVRAMLATHHSFDLCYEDLVGPDAELLLGRLQRFLGVEARSLRTAFVKLAEDHLRKEIANFKELAQAFAGTPLAVFLEE
jgi:hypothetical protein